MSQPMPSLDPATDFDNTALSDLALLNWLAIWNPIVGDDADAGDIDYSNDEDGDND